MRPLAMYSKINQESGHLTQAREASSVHACEASSPSLMGDPPRTSHPSWVTTADWGTVKPRALVVEDAAP